MFDRKGQATVDQLWLIERRQGVRSNRLLEDFSRRQCRPIHSGPWHSIVIGEAVKSRIQHIVFATLAIGGAGIAAYYVRPNRDLGYIGSTTELDGSSIVQTVGHPLLHGFNDRQYREGMASFKRHNFTDAERMFRLIIEKTPDEVSALQWLATTLFEQRRYDEAKEIFHTILKQDPHFYEARNGIGTIDRVQGRYTEAVEEYSFALQENPTFALAYYGRGLSYSDIGKRTEARSDLNQVQLLLPPTAELAIQARSYLDKL
jgi:tetratricopeptide (TPR) repeat protein